MTTSKMVKHTLKAYAVALVARPEGDRLEYDALVFEHRSGDIALGGGSVERPDYLPIDQLANQKDQVIIAGLAKEMSEELGLNERRIQHVLSDDRYTINLGVTKKNYRNAVHEITTFVTDVTSVITGMQNCIADHRYLDRQAIAILLKDSKTRFVQMIDAQIRSRNRREPYCHCNSPLGLIDLSEVIRVKLIKVEDLWKLADNHVTNCRPAMWDVNARMMIMDRGIKAGVARLLQKAHVRYGYEPKRSTTPLSDITRIPRSDISIITTNASAA